MTLDEFMSNHDGIAAIGASTGYFFVGNKEQYEREIDGLYKVARFNAHKMLADANCRLEALRAGGFKTIEETPVYIPQTDDLDILKGVIKGWRIDADRLEQQAKTLKSFADKFEEQARRKAKAEEIINSKPYRERDIIDMYPSITEKKMCVIIEGKESGSFWDLSEAERRRHDTRKNIKHNA